MEVLDCRALKCPHPVVEVRKRLLERPAEPLLVLVGDPVARENVTRLAQNQGFQVRQEPAEEGTALHLTPGKAPPAPAAAGAVTGKTVVFVTADTMGSGSDDLGRLLLKNFLFTLTEIEPAPDVMLFVNAGVKLTAEGSEAREALEKLACQGVDIASCGLCLDYFNLKEKLAVGRATNMLDIVETLRQAGRTIRP